MNFTDARLDGAIEYLHDHAGELLKAAIAAHYASDDVRDPQKWIKQTPLWRDLLEEVDGRRYGEGRSPVLAMHHVEEETA